MSTQNKLVLGLMQVDNLISLLEGNEYQQFLYSHLIPIRTELKRQLTNLEHSSKITE
jgi:hypothetical protein